MIDVAEALRMATRQAQEVDDLPDYLAARIYTIADLLPTVCHDMNDIQKLTEQVKLYDTYGQTGYLGMGVNHSILEKTITHIEKQLEAKK